VKYLKHSILGMAFLWAGSMPTETFASPLIRKQLSIGEASGQTGVNAVVSLSPMQSLTISFIKTGEVVKKVWLGNPAKVVIDYDSPLCKDAAKESSCGANVIYLRELAQPLDLDMNLPASAKGDLTSLTVITTGSGGNKNLYQFQLVLGESTPPYSVLEVVPDSQIRRLAPILPIRPAATSKLSSDS
jgi:hypothetical protein